MKKHLLFITLLIFTFVLSADCQTITDAGGRQVGSVRGQVYYKASSLNQAGYVNGNTVYDAAGRQLGYFSGQTIFSASGSQLGYVSQNGLYSGNSKIGSISGNVIYDAAGLRPIIVGSGLSSLQMITFFYFFL